MTRSPGIIRTAIDFQTGWAPTGRQIRLDQDDPLITAARLVQEDLCLLRAGAEGYALAAAVVCFPSRWSLAEKAGKPLRAIHGPVPDYEAELTRPVDRFFDMLKPERPVWRANWSGGEPNKAAAIGVWLVFAMLICVAGWQIMASRSKSSGREAV